MSAAAALIERLQLSPHPEGGWYRELYRSSERVQAERGARCALTSIYYLLEHAQVSRWHVVAADEIWHFYDGSPLELFVYDAGQCKLRTERLGGPASRHQPVGIVPRGHWQAARTRGAYSLLGCSVAPGFEFEDFALVAQLPGHAEHFAAELRELRTLL